ncbi:hypothetical protein [Arenicella xantha]|uniref:Uncharacterized protein n=1 Tax=Arenicella xantha TaxID=644221 RepID=A0A395JGM2_9GAMM|nr:hypothetical protein [Arenicella xantha]RBP48626.1 hypothetical protein DFR28_106113 [Arenicella xantha]
MKTLLSVLFLFPLIALSQGHKSSESELVAFLNNNGYSVVSNETQDVTIHYQEKSMQWSVRFQGKCMTAEKPNCVCIDCESYIVISDSKKGFKVLGVVLDG